MPNFVEIFSTLLINLSTTVGSLGWAIIIFTVVIRSFLVPLTLPSMKAKKNVDKAKPELDKLKIKYKDNKTALAQAQMELYKKYNINPMAGCVPQILQLVVLIILYRTFISILTPEKIGGLAINTQFLWADLVQPDGKFVLPILAGVTQLVLSMMLAPGGETLDIVPNKSKNKKVKEANKKEEDVAEMASAMQQQMLFIMPVMTAFIATRFPAGLALYWVISTVFSIVQQYFVSGLGGLKIYIVRILAKFKQN